MKDKPFELVTIDVQEESEVILSFMKQNKLSFRVLLDYDGFVSHRYRVRSHPMKFLIDPNGKIVAYAVGYRQWDSDTMKLLIRKVSLGKT